jgi:hypothetical protein
MTIFRLLPTTLFLLFCGFSLMGQPAKFVDGAESRSSDFLSGRSSADTLNISSFTDGYFLYKVGSLGYAAGTNVFDDQAKVQTFFTGKDFNLNELLIRFAYKSFNSGLASSSIAINFYTVNASGLSSVGNSSRAPGSILHSISVSITDIDTSGLMSFTQGLPLFCNDSIAIGIDLSNLHELDTIALYCSKEGKVKRTDCSWESAGNGTWNTFKYSWPLDVDLAIFPVVDFSTGFSDLKGNSPDYHVYPNPVSGTMVYVESNDFIRGIEVYSISGAIFKRISDDSSFGGNLLQLETSDMPKGIYFLNISGIKSKKIVKLVLN